MNRLLAGVFFFSIATAAAGAPNPSENPRTSTTSPANDLSSGTVSGQEKSSPIPLGNVDKSSAAKVDADKNDIKRSTSTVEPVMPNGSPLPPKYRIGSPEHKAALERARLLQKQLGTKNEKAHRKGRQKEIPIDKLKEDALRELEKIKEEKSKEK